MEKEKWRRKRIKLKTICKKRGDIQTKRRRKRRKGKNGQEIDKEGGRNRR